MVFQKRFSLPVVKLVQSVFKAGLNVFANGANCTVRVLRGNGLQDFKMILIDPLEFCFLRQTSRRIESNEEPGAVDYFRNTRVLYKEYTSTASSGNFNADLGRAPS
jgi:hypothetical protein